MRYFFAACACYAIAFVLSIVTSQQEDYVNEWAVHVIGGDEHARDVAEELGFIYGGKIGSLDDFYHFRRPSQSVRMRRSVARHTQRLKRDKRITWAEQQKAKLRVKRDFVSKRQAEEYMGFTNNRQIERLLGLLDKPQADRLLRLLNKRQTEGLRGGMNDRKEQDEGLQSLIDKRQQEEGLRNLIDKRQQEEKAYRSVHYDDTFWENEWYLDPYRKRSPHPPDSQPHSCTISEPNKQPDSSSKPFCFNVTYNDPLWNQQFYLVSMKDPY